MRMSEFVSGKVLVFFLYVTRADGGKQLDNDNANHDATQGPAHTAQRRL